MASTMLTKIIATISPLTDDEETLRELLKEGVRAFRINFSHGTYSEHEDSIKRLRKLASEMNIVISICIDTRGPELRIEIINTSEIPVKKDQIVSFSNIRSETEIYLPFPNFTTIPVGTKVYLDDGMLGIEIVETTKSKCVGKVINAHRLKNNKKISIPGTNFRSAACLERDRKDIEFAIQNKVDIIFASFSSTRKEVETLRKWANDDNILIWSKIETLEGVNNIEEIIKVSDGIMIARGDLCVEMSHDEMFRTQKILSDKCKKANIPFIVATQLLESMITACKPTRAEIVDVGSAVLDRADALLLSAETAMGEHPPLVVHQMKGLIRNAERYKNELTVTEHSCTLFGHKTKNTCFAVRTSSLRDVLYIYKTHPFVPVFIVSSNEVFLSKINLYREIFPFKCDEGEDKPKVIKEIKEGYGVENVYFLELDKGDGLKKVELF